MPDIKIQFPMQPWDPSTGKPPYECTLNLRDDGLWIEFTRDGVTTPVGFIKVEVDRGMPRVLTYISEEASEEPVGSIHLAPDHAIVSLYGNESEITITPETTPKAA